MIRKRLITIGFAGIYIRFILPSEVNVPRELSTFLCEDTADLDAEYRVVLINDPLVLTGPPLSQYMGMEVYDYQGQQLRLYPILTEKDGCQVACLLSDTGENILYYPASRWKFYADEWHCLHLIGVETVLLRTQSFLLHSSVVMKNGQIVLFSGPSGMGKSTQAALWERYLGAEILNGDRCIVKKTEAGFIGCGSPWCGTSGIYRQEQAPIRGIFVLRQAQGNSVRRVGIEGFSKLFQQCIVNSWDEMFVMKLTELLMELLERIPVYELACRPDEEAVQLAYNTVFGGVV